MDLNQLLYHHQLAVMCAEGQRDCDPCDVSLVEHYARRIRETRAEQGSVSDHAIVWSRVSA